MTDLSATRYRRIAALLIGLVLLLPTWSGEAHEIPADVTIQSFVKAEGGVLRLLVRVPLEALSDMAFPTFGPGYLDFETARRRDQFTDAAMVWTGSGFFPCSTGFSRIDHVP